MRTFLLAMAMLCLGFNALSQQVAKSLTAANGNFIGFYEFKPYDYSANPGKKYPLIIFLHGVGERGNGTTELNRVTAHAIPKYCAAGATMTFTYQGQQHSFLVLSPQLSSYYGSWEPFYVEEMIKHARQNLQVDTNRIYIAGLSLGGGGTWRYPTYSAANAKQIAAIAPVCGTCEWTTVCNIAQNKVAVWAFHAQDDGVVGVGCTNGAVDAINYCNPQIPAIKTIYSSGGHWIWDMAFDTTNNRHTPNMYQWLLSNSKSATPAPAPPPTNVAPVAKAGNDQVISLPTTSVNLDGSGSYDTDGNIASYSWSKISGPSTYTIGNTASSYTGVNSLASGVYSFRLQVTDNYGAVAADTVSITVNTVTGLQPPVAEAGGNQSIAANNTVLNSWGSSSPNGAISSYLWQQISGPNNAAFDYTVYSTARVSSLTEGTYWFRLTVTDVAGMSASDSVKVVVTLNSGAGQNPVAAAGPDQTITTSNTVLNSWGSSSPNGVITSYLWQQVSGPNTATLNYGTYATASVSNMIAGVYKFRLTVKDATGASGSDTMMVTVNTTAVALPPVAQAGPSQYISGTSAILNSWGSTSPNGPIASYNWQLISGPAGAVISYGNYAVAIVNNLVQGTYTFKLTITDVSGASATATTNVYVNVNGGGNANNTNTAYEQGMAATNTNSRGFVIEKMYPNPTKDLLIVQLNNDVKGNGRLAVYDMNGRLLLQQAVIKTFENYNSIVNMKTLSPGLYLVEVKIGDTYRVMQRIVKN